MEKHISSNEMKPLETTTQKGGWPMKMHEEICMRAIDRKLQDLREQLEVIEPIYRDALASKMSLERRIKTLQEQRFNIAQVEFDFSESAVF